MFYSHQQNNRATLSKWVIFYHLSIQALTYPYFHGLANVDREPSTVPISKMEFEFERRKLAKDDVRELIYREVNEQHMIPGS